MGWLSDTEEKELMGSIHWGKNVEKTAKELRVFIDESKNKKLCEKGENYLFLYFNDAEDYIERFEKDMKISVLGSRPGLYIFKQDSPNKEGLKIGESERLHERMKSHSSGKSPYIKGPGVVIVRWTGIRKEDQFNVHEMRKLCEFLINDFLKNTTGDYDTFRKDGPRAYVSVEGCEQAVELMEDLKTASAHSQFGNIATVQAGKNTKDEAAKALDVRGVKSLNPPV